MSVLIHQPIRCLFAWTLIIILFLLTQTIAQAAQMPLAWDPNNPVPEGYGVFARIEGQSYDYSSHVWPQQGDDPNQTNCTIPNIVDGTSYYVVPAIQGAGESPDSNEVSHVPGQTNTKVYGINLNQKLAQVVKKMPSDFFEQKPEIWPLLIVMFILCVRRGIRALFNPKLDLKDNFDNYFRRNRRCRNSCHLKLEKDHRGENDRCLPVYVETKWCFFWLIITILLYCFAHSTAFNFKGMIKGLIHTRGTA